MTSYKPGQVILIPFPFTDLSTHKQRPALVISSRRFNRTHSDLIVIALTSQLSQPPSNDEYLLSEIEQREAGLPKESMIKLGKIVTLDQRLVRRSLGQLPSTSIATVIAGINEIIGE